VALLVDPGAVHRDQQSCVRVLFGHGGDARAVEREVRADVDVEEVDRFAAFVDDRRTFPDGPPVIVTRRRGRQRRVPHVLLRPGSREVPREILVVDLEHDLPAVASVANDHRARASARANWSRCSRTASSGSTSPYFASMSKRFASWALGFRSPTASRGTTTRHPCCHASTAVARTHPHVDAPATTTPA